MPIKNYYLPKLLPVLLILIIGIMTSFGAARYAQKAHEAQITATFKANAKDKITVIRNALEDDLATLRAMVSFFHSSDEVSHAEYTTFATQLLADHPDIPGMSWIPHITAAARAAFEQSARQIYPDFALKELRADGVLAPVSEKSDYYPVLYVRPAKDNEHIIGFDISSNAERNAAMQQSGKTHDITASARVQLIRDDARLPGIVLFAPVFEHDNRGETTVYGTLKGFIGFGVPFEGWINHAIATLAPSGTHIILRDLSAPPHDNVMYIRHSHLTNTTDADVLKIEAAHGPLLLQDSFEIGGRHWQITIIPADGYYDISSHLTATFILAAGLLFTLIFTLYLFLQITQKLRVQYQVEQRTRELLAAKQQTELLLNSTSDGMIGLNADSEVVFVNPHAFLLLQYLPHEMIGRKHHELFHHSMNEVEICPIDQALQDGSIHTAHDELFCRKDGSCFPVEYTCAPIHDGQQITGAVIAFRNIEERKRNEEKLRHLAQYDQLTGVANRALFTELLTKALDRAERKSTKIGLIYIDLNDFKILNDTLGHAAGDELLQVFSDRVTQTLRTYDTIARLGGDEFIIIVDDIIQTRECGFVVERIQTALAQPVVIRHRTVVLSISIGTAVYPDDAKTMDALISAADTAMYADKKRIKATTAA